jgi:hypothetical protein
MSDQTRRKAGEDLRIGRLLQPAFRQVIIVVETDTQNFWRYGDRRQQSDSVQVDCRRLPEASAGDWRHPPNGWLRPNRIADVSLPSSANSFLSRSCDALIEVEWPWSADTKFPKIRVKRIQQIIPLFGHYCRRHL